MTANEIEGGSSSTELPVVIIGGGVSGLTAAYRLHQAGRKVIVCEASSRAGGNIQTIEHDGFLYDLGPDSFLRTKPEAAKLCHDLGLGDELISPLDGASKVFVAYGGKLHPMPEGLSLGVPKRPGPLLQTPLLGGGAKLRAMMEPFVRRPKNTGEESISEFMTRRLGSEMATRLAAPLLSGVFAGDATKLSMNATFPMLVAAEKKYGSLFSGMNGGKSMWKILTEKKPPPPSPFMSLRRGMGSLVDRLISSLPADTLRLSSPVISITPPNQPGSPALVHLSSSTLKASHVLFAGPPWAAAKLLGNLGEKLGAPLAKVRGFATATAFFGLTEKLVSRQLVGSGFIVPPGEAEILAGTFISSKWEGRSKVGSVLVRAFVGGARQNISNKSAGDLQEIAHRELTRLLGPLGPVKFSRVHLFERGTPQPELGHNLLLKRINDALEERPWLSLIGSGYGGVGIPDCIRQAGQSVDKILNS